MAGLAAEDLTDILEIADISLACASWDDFVPLALNHLERAFDAQTSCCFRIRRTSAGDETDTGFSNWVDRNTLEKYHHHYKFIDPFMTRAIKDIWSRRRSVLVSDHVVPYDAFQNSEFYNDFLKPISVHRLMGFGLRLNDHAGVLLAIHRPKGRPRFSRRAQAKARLAVPHLTAALDRMLTHGMVAERDWILDHLSPQLGGQGVMVLDRQLTVQFADDRARALIGARPGTAGAMLALPEALRAACRTLKSGETGKARLSSIRSNQLSMAIRRVDYGADGARYIVIFEKDIPPIIPEERLKRHGLTSREIDIAHLVSAGMTNPQIAEKLCISPRTVQNHLRSIFDKTGIHNRTSLVYRLTAPT